MSNEKFLKDKLSLLQKNNQNGFKDFVGPMHEMADKNETSRVIKIPADGNWFKLSFDTVQLKEDRVVITAHRIYDGMTPSRSDSSTYEFRVEFRVEFQGTRAGYLFGEYHQRHPLGGWPFISWDVRSYVNSLQNPGMRIYVSGFYAHNEIKRMIIAMQSY